MIWSRYSMVLAFSFAAMTPSLDIHTAPAQSRPSPLSGLAATDPALRAQTACEAGRAGVIDTTDIARLAGLLGDDTRVEAAECGNRWGGGLGPEPGVCLTTPGAEAARALARVGRAAVAPLVAALANPGAVVRRHAAAALGLIDDETVVEPALPRLIAALGDADWQVRRTVAWTLGEAGGRAARGPLSKALADAHPRVRATAAHALGDLEDASAVEALAAAVKGDSDVEVREMAAWALGEIGQPSAVPALVGALRDADWRPRVKAAWALGEISSAEGVDGLLAAMKDAHARVREMAAWALGEIGSPGAIDALVAALKDTDWQVRAKAAWALGEIADRRAADSLAASMKDEHPQVRKMAAWALAEALGQ